MTPAELSPTLAQPVLVPSSVAVPVAESPDAARKREKDLIVASKAFTVENRLRSWGYTFSTFAVIAALVAGVVVAPWPWLKMAFGVLEGLTVVRAFCLMHDFYHGAILRQSKAADGIFTTLGMFIFVPPSVWKETHNYHHAHAAKIVGSHIGSYPVVTTSMWKEMSPFHKTLYTLARHPLNMVFAIFTVFMLGMCVRPFVRAPKKHWGGLLSLVCVFALAGTMISLGHVETWFYAWFLPAWVAMMTGAYLFYAQHNFEDAHFADRASWSFTKAALESSSYFRMNPVMHWFTANIGYHHVHHLNAAIPFYRLRETMEAIPELQAPGETSWAPSEVLKNFKLKLWDPEKDQMVGYR